MRMEAEYVQYVVIIPRQREKLFRLPRFTRTYVRARETHTHVDRPKYGQISASRKRKSKYPAENGIGGS